MSDHYIATEYAMSKGVGVSEKRLPSFDKALLDAGVGNYNLVRLSSILPAHCRAVPIEDLTRHIKEGSLLPTAYSTVTSQHPGEMIASAMAIGFPEDESHVGVIMEYSAKGCSAEMAELTVIDMVKEAFVERGWELKNIKTVSIDALVGEDGAAVTTFACVAEW